MTIRRELLTIADQAEMARSFGRAILDGSTNRSVSQNVALMLLGEFEKQVAALRKLAERQSSSSEG